VKCIACVHCADLAEKNTGLSKYCHSILYGRNANDNNLCCKMSSSKQKIGCVTAPFTILIWCYNKTLPLSMKLIQLPHQESAKVLAPRFTPLLCLFFWELLKRLEFHILTETIIWAVFYIFSLCFAPYFTNIKISRVKQIEETQTSPPDTVNRANFRRNQMRSNNYSFEPLFNSIVTLMIEKLKW